MRDDIQILLEKHRQIYDRTCSASAHEFIAKLHGLLDDSEFPLQHIPGSQRGGFEFEGYLNSICLTGNSVWLDAKTALSELAKETANERYPLISVLACPSKSKTDWHIVVAVPYRQEVALIDPAKQDYITRTSADTWCLLHDTATAVPGRAGVNLLIYKTMASSAKGKS